MTLAELKQEIKTSLANKYKVPSTDEYKLSVLEDVIDNAIEDIKIARHYPKSMKNSAIEEDILSYGAKIQRLAEFDYLQTGAVGQVSHNENGINRTWIDRARLFSGVLPFCR